MGTARSGAPYGWATTPGRGRTESQEDSPSHRALVHWCTGHRAGSQSVLGTGRHVHVRQSPRAPPCTPPALFMSLASDTDRVTWPLVTSFLVTRAALAELRRVLRLSPIDPSPPVIASRLAGDGAVAVLREGGRAEEGAVDAGGGPEAARLHRAARPWLLALAAGQGR